MIPSALSFEYWPPAPPNCVMPASSREKEVTLFFLVEYGMIRRYRRNMTKRYTTDVFIINNDNIVSFYLRQNGAKLLTVQVSLPI